MVTVAEAKGRHASVSLSAMTSCGQSWYRQHQEDQVTAGFVGRALESLRSDEEDNSVQLYEATLGHTLVLGIAL